MAICLAACLAVAACSSFERLADRHQRHRRYTQALRALPEPATRADIYAALPPQTMPAPPGGFAIMGVGAMATERYPLDADYEVVIPFLYARSKLIYARSMAYFDSAKPCHFTRSIQSPRDMIVQPSHLSNDATLHRHFLNDRNASTCALATLPTLINETEHRQPLNQIDSPRLS